ncbi:MAG: alternative ribosome rescue aminoacyl-tRNA hydrolase ArfB [Planctomycetota bacterium]|jgi:ribosome-associated protein|nr:alternative ribosome rescue aminoacyl-tRNA hydrolase ArfB [Planctomycetota bacterium]MDP6740271.1 alternative ribosome rescue aminoacyl-tRNA hydrolase ArfB [Planctomycetota bacterium]MDP6938469.1 alternative ribosome rescue aminoacyl-tRNA hydrolase ArfB [Planctomycetota bacterium]
MEPLRINARLILPPNELHVSFSRSGGPGGQNVNKVATRVQLRFCVLESPTLGEHRRARLVRQLGNRLTKAGEVVVHASSHRERGRNLEEARQRLASLLRTGLQVPKRRKATKPTRASKRKRLDAKRKRGDLKRSRRPDAD